MTAGVECTRYIDHFWGDKHNGYQVLYDNVKKSDDVAAEVAHFIKERLAIEEEYVKALNRSVQRVTSFINAGSNFEPAWMLTKGTVELLAEIHLMMVKNLQDLTREVTKYKDDLLKSRKELKQQSALEAVSLMQTTTTCLQKAKETYHTRFSELEKIRKENSQNAKEVAKAELKAAKAKEEYKNYVEKYASVRYGFEEAMEDACKKFETFDRSLYAALQQFLLMFASHMSETAQSSLQVSAQFRESLQQVNVETFIEKVTRTRGTGTERPAHITFEEVDPAAHLHEQTTGSFAAKDIIDLISVGNSDPSSCSSSGVLPQEPLPATQSKSTIDLLTMETPEPPLTQPPLVAKDELMDRKISMPSFSSSNTNLSTAPSKKFSLFIPKRKKKESQSSVDEEPAGGIFNKFTREKRGSRKSTQCDEHSGSLRASVCFDDAQSTTSSSKSDERALNGNPFDAQINNGEKRIDEEGYIIRDETREQPEDTNWSCSSSEDEEEMQRSRIRSLTIRPADKLAAKNASVDELRDAIGSITLTRSTTFDKDPWLNSRPPPQFSQSMSGTTFRHPLKTNHTADGIFRTKFSESDYSESNVPPSFSVSMGYNAGMSGMARARPRSNTPTYSTLQSINQPLRKESTGSLADAWGSSFNMATSESNHSFGESSFNLSQSTGNLLQATISEQRVPLAMAVNEFAHVWFKNSDLAQCVQRMFGTVMISFASSSIGLLTQYQQDFEALAFTVSNSAKIKTILPNKQLIDESLTKKDEDGGYTFTFSKHNLAEWLREQQRQKPDAGFYNAEVARYELHVDETIKPPLYLMAYWKFEAAHTDIRVDYRLNTDTSIMTPMINVQFTTELTGQFDTVTAEPEVNWNKEKSTLSWNVLEISRHGEVGGSLKARASVANPSPEVSLEMINRKPAQVFAQFQCHDANLSGVDVGLVASDIYHLSMVRRKIIAGKYFCEPELRQ